MEIEGYADQYEIVLPGVDSILAGRRSPCLGRLVGTSRLRDTVRESEYAGLQIVRNVRREVLLSRLTAKTSCFSSAVTSQVTWSLPARSGEERH
ncbi:hypothetical protein TNCV_1797531 [Trichonephila clavipes]|nr:hypothetical protein TNCV_1797531 [Trichonephila clavipes]